MIQTRYPKLASLLGALLLALFLAACTTNSPPEEEPEPGTLIVNITGLPGGVDGDVDVTGPGFSQSLTSSTTIDDLDAGSYTVSAESVSDGADVYGPVVSGSPANVTEGGTVTVTVDYVFLDPTTVGTLQVNIEGLSGLNGDVTVTGPGGFNQSLTATTTLSNLTPASYSVSAEDVSDGGATYQASVDVTEPVVFPEETTTVTVSYDRVAEDDGDSEVNAAVYAQFRNTAGAEVWVDTPLFNEDDVLDVQGLQYRNEVSNPGDETDWLAFELFHGDGATTTIDMTLECDPDDDDLSPVRVTLFDDDGSNLSPVLLCGETQSYAIDNSGGNTDHLVEIEARELTEGNFNSYILSINGYCFPECEYTEHTP